MEQANNTSLAPTNFYFQYVCTYTEATTDELCTFLIANGDDVYSRQIVSRRCAELGLTRKCSSREVYDTFNPESLREALWFRSEPPPLGVRGWTYTNCVTWTRLASI